MLYRECLDYLYNQFPVYQQIGKSAYKPTLENTIALCQLCDNPQLKFKSIHVAGTNGKGSVTHMLTSILMASGYKVGLFTSPHLKDFTERIKINGKPIPKSYVVSFTNTYHKKFEKIKPSFFELTMAMACRYFADKKVDVVVFETGLGGRLDATNIINPELSIITSIALDHQEFLGNTLAKIAAEKAGIIKKNKPVVIGESTAGTRKVFISFAKKNNSQIYFAEENKYNLFASDLKGWYQKKNQTTVLCAVDVLRNLGWNISNSSLKKGLAHTVKNTGLMGRWQILQNKPLMVADIAHNAAGIREIVEQLRSLKYKKLHVVFGVVKDKDVKSMLKLLPKSAHYYFTQATIPRALPATELEQLAKTYHLIGNSYTSVKKACHAAKRNASTNDAIYIGGSAFVVAEAI